MKYVSMLVLVLVMSLSMAIGIEARPAAPMVEGSGVIVISSTDQDQPAFQGPKWYVHRGLRINAGLVFFCEPTGTIHISGPIDNRGTYMDMWFWTGGVVQRNLNKNIKVIGFNGTGGFVLYRPSHSEDRPSLSNVIEEAYQNEEGLWEHGSASIHGAATINIGKGIGRIVKAQIHGGNFGYLFNAFFTGDIRLNELEQNTD